MCMFIHHPMPPFFIARLSVLSLEKIMEANTMTSVRLEENQERFIAKSGIKQSDFIRRSIDYYILYLENPYNMGMLNELEQWIRLKRNTFETHMNTNVTQTDTNATHMDTNVPICNTNNTDVTQYDTQNNNKPTQTSIADKLKEELPMLRRQLKNPEVNNTIPDHTLKVLSKKYDLSKSTIQSWITENKQWIIEGEFTQEQPE